MFNDYHYYLVHLLNKGVKLITTNQDTFIENAAVYCSIPLKRVVTSTDKTHNWNYLKLHGSVDKDKSLRVILEKTSFLEDWKAELIKSLKNKKFLFIGYGGWDIDILTFLRNFKIKSENFFWFEWSKKYPSNYKEICRNIFHEKFRENIIYGEKTYEIIFKSLIPEITPKKSWEQKLENDIQLLTNKFSRKIALANAFKSCWNGKIATTLLHSAKPLLSQQNWKTQVLYYLNLANSYEQLHDKKQQLRYIKFAKKVLLLNYNKKEVLIYKGLLLLQQIEYYHSFNDDYNIRQSYLKLNEAEILLNILYKRNIKYKYYGK